jgi:uncharacterized membrane protein
VAALALAAEVVAFAAPSGGPAAGGLQVLRLVLGVPAVLLLPGFALSALLFPRTRDVDGFERIALAGGLSVAQAPLLALALDRSTWRLTPESLIVATCSVTCLWCLLAVIRGAGLAPEPRPAAAALGLGLRGAALGRRWWPSTRWERAAALLCVLLAAISAWAILTVATRPAVPPLTEFFVLGQGGLVEEYPRSAAPGEPVQVTVGITNREGAPADYHAAVSWRGQVLAQTTPLRVAAGQTWTGNLQFALPEYGFEQRVEVQLFRGDEGVPYRRLQLVIDVPPPGEPTPVRAQQTPAPRR